MANAQLAVGGSAAMVYLLDEAEFLAKAGGAAYINVGTLLPIYEQSLPRAAKVLHDAGKPWVLDPVAIGIGSLRTELLRQFKAYKPSVIRGMLRNHCVKRFMGDWTAVRISPMSAALTPRIR